MKPIIALIGQQNVGKSTLYNRLTKTSDAIVANYAGLTRDRQYGDGKIGGKSYTIIDTGGIIDESEPLNNQTQIQTQIAIEEADIIFFMVDAKIGINQLDFNIAESLRKNAKNFYLLANKIDGTNQDEVNAICLELGIGEPLLISAAGGRGIKQLMDKVFKDVDFNDKDKDKDKDTNKDDDDGSIKISLVGKPNVGKSTLLNHIIDKKRCITLNKPGTTIDSIFVPFTYKQQEYTLIDTAGLRKKRKIYNEIEKYSIIKSYQAIEKSDVVLFLTDASDNISVQDLHILSHIRTCGKPSIILANKWDKLNHNQKLKYTQELTRRLSFDNFAIIENISAINDFPKTKIFKQIKQLWHQTRIKISTPVLNTLLKQATTAHQPPKSSNRRIKLKYAHQGGSNPPLIIIHGTKTKKLPPSYHNYLNNFFIKTLKLKGIPLKIICKDNENPYDKK
ncbi:MAG: ribosome biogenesis GTPase Der [Gammaproteobacteria bacterium]|nr:MAG: ribosome biogenesis GTPase Der [Gammaproteobacteria bacterium]